MKVFYSILTLILTLGVIASVAATGGYAVRSHQTVPVSVVRYDVCGTTAEFIVTYADGTAKPFPFPMNQDQFTELQKDIKIASHKYVAGAQSEALCHTSDQSAT